MDREGCNVGLRADDTPGEDNLLQIPDPSQPLPGPTRVIVFGGVEPQCIDHLEGSETRAFIEKLIADNKIQSVTIKKKRYSKP